LAITDQGCHGPFTFQRQRPPTVISGEREHWNVRRSNNEKDKKEINPGPEEYGACCFSTDHGIVRDIEAYLAITSPPLKLPVKTPVFLDVGIVLSRHDRINGASP
jgi:hypothetical protein